MQYFPIFLFYICLSIIKCGLIDLVGFSTLCYDKHEGFDWRIGLTRRWRVCKMRSFIYVYMYIAILLYYLIHWKQFSIFRGVFICSNHIFYWTVYFLYLHVIINLITELIISSYFVLHRILRHFYFISSNCNCQYNWE